MAGSRVRLPQLQWVRALAALLVVCFHADAIVSLPKYLGAGLPAFRAGDSGVQLFFVLSGFVIHYAHVRDPERSGTAIRRFIGKRVRRLYPPLWAVLLPILPVVLLVGDAGTWDIIAALTIAPVPVERVLAVEWTLRHEILFYAMFLVVLWNRRAGWAAIALWAIASAATTLAQIGPAPSSLAGFLLNPNHALFLMGMVTSWLFHSGRTGGARIALIAGGAVFAATYIAVAIGALGHDLAPLAYGLGGAGAIFGLVASPGPVRSHAWLEHLGNASYALYLIHFPLLSVFAKMWVGTGIDRVPAWIVVLLFAGICQAAALLFHSWIERPAIALYDRAASLTWSRSPRSPAVPPP